MLPGTISVWILPEDSAFPGLPYVIFPGNVGEAGTLAEVIERLRRERYALRACSSAAAAGRAVGAFTCYDLLGFEAVSAPRRRAPRP